jgi:HK97 family phage prohead protease
MEVRILSNLQVRTTGGKSGIAGYAAMFNSLSEELGGFREQIRRGAFARAIRTGQDVRCLFNHDTNCILGRTKSGTLKLSEDSAGLHFDCALGNSPTDRDVLEAVDRGDIDQCSFGFICPKGGDTWAQTADGDIRTLLDVDLLDVSPVTYPAYQATSVAARKFLPQDAPMELRCQYQRGGLVSVSYRFRSDERLESARRLARLRLARLQN